MHYFALKINVLKKLCWSVQFLKLEHQNDQSFFDLAFFVQTFFIQSVRWDILNGNNEVKTYSKYIYNWRVRWLAQCISGCTESLRSATIHVRYGCTGTHLKMHLSTLQRIVDNLNLDVSLSADVFGVEQCRYGRSEWLNWIFRTHQLDLKMALGIKVDGSWQNTWPCQQKYALSTKV